MLKSVFCLLAAGFLLQNGVARSEVHDLLSWHLPHLRLIVKLRCKKCDCTARLIVFMAACEVEFRSLSLPGGEFLTECCSSFEVHELLSRNLPLLRLEDELFYIQSDCAAQSVDSMAVCQF